MNKFYQLVANKEKRTAKLDIYGTIRSYRAVKEENSYYDGTTGVNSYDLKKEIDALTDTDRIDVYINSYGGEVAEALSIYNTLTRHSAKVITHIDGIAASAASIVFMAGDVRQVGDVGLLMIHNCMTGTFGANSDQLRKLAEDNDKWNQQSIDVYVAKTGQTEKQIQKWMNAETYFTVAEMLKYGFATEKESVSSDTSTTQDAFSSIQHLIGYGAIVQRSLANAILYGKDGDSGRILSDPAEAAKSGLIPKSIFDGYEPPESKQDPEPKEQAPAQKSDNLMAILMGAIANKH